MATVHEILQKPFKRRTYDEKVKIILSGKPKPRIRTELLHSSFDISVSSLYDTESWLTGCSRLKSFLCWTCLLFVDELGSWNFTGFKFNNFKCLREEMVKHEKSSSHTQGMLKYQMFLQRVLLPGPDESANDAEESSVASSSPVDSSRKNCGLLQQILDLVWHVITQQSPTQAMASGLKKLVVENYAKHLHLLSSNEDTARNCINLLKTSPTVLTEILPAVSDALRDNIKAQIKRSTFVCVILNEHSDIECKSQISTVLRYVLGGEVHERFVGFTNFNRYKTVEVIYDHIQKVVKEYGFADKFVGYACDGGVLASSYHLNTLKKKLRGDYLNCSFVPCHFHELHVLLEQNLSNMKECNLFFKTLNSLRHFFRSAKTCDAFDGFVRQSVMKPLGDEKSNCKFLGVVKMHRRQLIKFFMSVAKDFESWEPEALLQAIAFQHILQEFDTIFFLEAFSRIFNYTSKLNDILRGSSPEAAFGSSQPDNLRGSLEMERAEYAFELFWIAVVSEILDAVEPKPKSLKTASEPGRKLLYRECFLKIVECVIQEIECRFGFLTELVFFHILNFEENKKIVFSKERLDSLLSAYRPYFNHTWLSNEINVLCANDAVFLAKSSHELMDFFTSNNLQTTFVNLFKLTELTLTMPCKPPSAAVGISKLDEIRPWYHTGEDETDLVLLCIEEDLLRNLLNKEDFLCSVLAKCPELNDV